MSKRILMAAAICGIGLIPLAASAKDLGWTDKEWSRFTDAIHQVESNGGNNVFGDGGDSIGGYQISEAAFQDAQEFDPSIKGEWKDCLTDLNLSKKVCVAYIKRYAPAGATPEDCARIWNGGPKGHKKEATLHYAKKFKRVY